MSKKKKDLLNTDNLSHYSDKTFVVQNTIPHNTKKESLGPNTKR